MRGPFSFNTAGPTAREVTRSHDGLLLSSKGTETMMCDSYAQFDDGAGRSGGARAVSNEDLGVIQGMLLSTGVSDAASVLARISRILDRAVAG